MAQETKCQTPGAVYNTAIHDTCGTTISIDVITAKHFDLSEEEAELLEANIHNALELVLAPYYIQRS